jgi:hypothetical protein
MREVDYELRCCCQPSNLLGWLRAPVGLRPGQAVRFVVRPVLRLVPGERSLRRPVVETIDLTLNIYTQTMRRLWHDDPHPSRPLEEWWRHEYPAFSSHDHPLDVVTRIAGFRPAHR